jgi:predicted nuclease of restriction endonuclease-like (RecB) superfamily
MKTLLKDSEYTNWIEQIKDLVKRTQIKASIIVNQELIKLYWQIGKSLSEASIQKKWGTSVVETLSKELSSTFPNQQGFSRSNLFAMKKLYEFYNDSSISKEIIQQLVGQIPFHSNHTVLCRI